MKNPYSNIPSTIWLLATVTLISRSGSMVLVFLPLYLTQKLHFNLMLAGQMLACYGLGEIAGSYLGGTLSDRFGYLRIQSIGLLLTGIFYLAFELLQIKIEIITIIFLVGLLTASIRPATGSNIAKHTTPDNRAQSYALNYQALNLGSALGPAIGGVLASFNYAWLFRIDGTANILAAIALLIFFYKRNEAPSPTLKVDLNHNLLPWQNKSFLILLVLVLLIGLCFFLFSNVYPFFLKEKYLISESKIGLILGINGLLVILFQMQITAFLKRFNSLRVAGIGGIIIALGYFILPFYSGFNYAVISIILISLGEMISMPFLFDYVVKIAPAESRGKYLGLLSCTLVSIPLTLTPTLGMFIYHKFGSTFLWCGIGVIGLVILIMSELISKKSHNLI
ncbi:MAG: MFS transporter [Gammaproteobacteria bacterium]|nr:MFS transporter [Gammaproteobacteria bacterium]